MQHCSEGLGDGMDLDGDGRKGKVVLAVVLSAPWWHPWRCRSPDEWGSCCRGISPLLLSLTHWGGKGEGGIGAGIWCRSAVGDKGVKETD